MTSNKFCLDAACTALTAALGNYRFPTLIFLIYHLHNIGLLFIYLLNKDNLVVMLQKSD